jgi:hypothetical protein
MTGLWTEYKCRRKFAESFKTLNQISVGFVYTYTELLSFVELFLNTVCPT